MIKMTDAGTLGFQFTNSFRLMVSQRISEAFVEAQGYYRLRQLVEVSPQNIRRVVHCVTSPVEALSISIW
jgi:hypothetical protein